MANDFDLNWLLVLEERQRITDGVGGFSETWVPVGNMWAHVEARGVTATEVTAGTTSRLRYRVIVRGASEGSAERPEIGQRFRRETRAYSIDSVSEFDASGRYLLCWVREEVLS